MMATPYTNEVANAIRLSCLLINEGTKCFKQRLLQEVKKMNKADLHVVLNDPVIKQKMRDYNTKPPKLLINAQFSLLYPKKGRAQIDTFDLTLICQLFSTLCNIPYMKTCTECDHTIAADICRIRNIRNQLYGHIVKIEMTTDEFKKEWKNLANILQRNGTSQHDIDKWETETLSPQDCENVKQEMFALMASDLSDIRELAKCLLEIVDNQKEQIIRQAEMNEEMKALIANIRNLIQRDETPDILPHIENFITNIQPELVNIVLQSVHSPISTIHHDLKEYAKGILEKQNIAFQKHEQVAEKQDVMDQKLDSIIDCTGKLLLASASKNHIYDFSEFSNILEERKDAYKILILNKPDAQYGIDDIKLLAKSIGYVPWDIIIDLDHDTRTEKGLHDKIANTYKCNKDFVVCTYKDARVVTEQETNMSRIVKGECGLYVLANGCKDTGCDPCDTKFGKSVTKIMPVINDIFERFSSVKPLMIFNLVLSESARVCFELLLQMIKTLVESNDDVIDVKLSNTLVFFTNDNFKLSFNEKSLFSELIQTDGTLQQVAHLLQNPYAAYNEQQFIYPGYRGMCFFTNSDIAQMKGIVELYHKDIGNLDVDDLTNEELEEKFCNIKFSYLKGNELSPEALYINEKDQVFVVRHEMSELLDHIEKELDGRKTWKSNSYFLLEHDPSGGGTTAIRYVLYNLRKSYPCLLASQISEKLFEWIQHIYEQSRLPILLVLDNGEYSKPDVEFVQIQLNNQSIKALVVHVKRREYRHAARKTTKIADYFIPSKTQREDQLAFRRLYQINKKKMEINKVFLFGLMKFCEEYQRLEHHLCECIDNASFEERAILQIVCFVWKYSHIPTRGQVISRLLSLNGTSSGRALDELGYINDLLVSQKEGLRPAHECVINPSLERLVGPDKGKQLQAFGQLMLSLVEDDSEGKKESTNIMYLILVERTVDNTWSKYLVDMEEYCDKQSVLAFLEEVEDLNKKHNTKFLSHYQMLQSRYLMYKMDEPDRAVSVMLNAMQVAPGQSVKQSKIVESPLLNTYGYLLRLRLQKLFDENKHKKTFDKDDFLAMALNDAQEAVYAFKKVQSYEKNISYSSLSDPISFIGEARVRAMLLHFHFELICKCDHEKFAKYISSCQDEFLKECEYEGLEALQQFEILFSLGKLQSANLDRGLQRARLTKFEFLRLRFDKGTSIKKVLNRLSEDEIPFDVSILVRSHQNHVFGNRIFSSPTNRSWYDLTVEELQLIINTIDKKIGNTKLLRCNYKDIIYAMIYIRQISIGKKTKAKMNKYNIDYAKLCAEHWTQKYPDDSEAHFMLGILLLVTGLQQERRSPILEALDHLDKCKKICLKAKRAFNFNKKRFAIGLGDGLEAVVPMNLVEQGKLAEFSGRQINKSIVTVRPFEILHARIDKHKDDIYNTSFHQQKNFHFNLVFTQNTILAQKIEDPQPLDDMEDI